MDCEKITAKIEFKTNKKIETIQNNTTGEYHFLIWYADSIDGVETWRESCSYISRPYSGIMSALEAANLFLNTGWLDPFARRRTISDLKKIKIKVR